MKWSFYQIWNESLENGEEKPLVSRQKIWASELGGAYIDRYLKMKAIPFTNPPNPRSKRKFEAGNIWESIIAYVLSRAGILISRQEWLGYQYPNLLPVSGKLDFLAGGHPDYSKALSIINSEFSWLPPFISKASSNIVSKLKDQYPNGLENIILELKSCSAFMFDVYEKNDRPNKQHKLQLFHYLKAKSMLEGHIVYICKDDARLLEIGVLNPSPVEDEYKEDIKQITEYYNNNTEPPKEKFIVFDEDFKKFSANYKVGYSQYLTYLYGLKNQLEFDEKYKPIVEKWNRVLGRIKEKKDMTDNNLETISEMTKLGFNIEKIKEDIWK